MENLDKKEFWLMTESMLQELLNQSQEKLDADSIESVQHYLDHSEYEMAFEGLFIELMKLNHIPKNADIGKYIELGKNLDLENESVFDADFWSKFVQFVSRT